MGTLFLHGRVLRCFLLVGLAALLPGCLCKPVEVKAEQKAALREGGTCPARAGVPAVKPTVAGARPQVPTPEEFATPEAPQAPVAGETPEARLVRLAKDDHTAFLELCLEHYRGHYRDYTCTFVKQERLNGDLGPEQTIEAKFLGQPFSVVLHWVANPPAGDMAIYVEGENDDKMIVRPEGIPGLLVGCLKVDPAGPEAMQHTRYPITRFGFERILERFVETNRRAQAEGDFRPEWGGTTAGVEDSGRPAILLIRHLPNKENYPAELTKVWIDREYLVPTRIDGYDWEGQLSYHYIYRDIRFNVGLAPDDFTPQANGFNCKP